ncbi:MAG: flagella accessory protein C [Candidatus Anstonellales archaeon]
MGLLDSILSAFNKKSTYQSTQPNVQKPSGIISQQTKKKPEVKVTVTSVPLTQLQSTINQQKPLQQQIVNQQMPNIQQKPNISQTQPLQGSDILQQQHQQINLQDMAKQIKQEGQKEDTSTMNRLADLEAKVQKLEIELNKISKETEANKNKLSEIDTRLIEMLSMYELISNQMNPFMGAENKVPQVAFEEMRKETEALRQELETLKANTEASLQEIREQLNLISNDVNLLASSRVDISNVIKSVLSKKKKELETQKMFNVIKNEVKQNTKKSEAIKDSKHV